ncbi:hypothetical protein KFK09_006468 [Dendrobium nobile]|uniref:Reverse transcriptase/retrotransposon-derived protein RNase H-like domain-containing protein n=1 Tax=Dendrobium nobile TaxID=94219 RepID=A0A8T3BRQ8_DENNO|nr:hypothetical protein KFK09_006468 [Dendrobium nobile]
MDVGQIIFGRPWLFDNDVISTGELTPVYSSMMVFEVTCDASSIGIGVVLSQEGHPVLTLEYTYMIRHKAGYENKAADALSCQIMKTKEMRAEFVPWDSKMAFGILRLVVFRAWFLGFHGLAVSVPWLLGFLGGLLVFRAGWPFPCLGASVPCLAFWVSAVASSGLGWANFLGGPSLSPREIFARIRSSPHNSSFSELSLGCNHKCLQNFGGVVRFVKTPFPLAPTKVRERGKLKVNFSNC